MSRSQRSRPSRAATAACTAVAALLLAACGAGQITDTAVQGSSAGGANAGVPGSVVVRDAEIEYAAAAPGEFVYPQGATAALRMHIVNEGAVGDRLVKASSTWAKDVPISGAVDLPAGRALVVGGQPATAPVDPAAAPAPAATQIVMVNLLGEIRAGLTYPVVLEFEKADAITLNVPVDNPDTPRETPTPEPAPATGPTPEPAPATEPE